MSMYAQITVIGPFHIDVIPFLEYPLEYYKSIKNGTTIISDLFGINGNALSTMFANLVGITDPKDFNQHEINTNNINWIGLQEFVNIYNEHTKDLNGLKVFTCHEFKLIFRPNM